jgi:hypothetical protein
VSGRRCVDIDDMAIAIVAVIISRLILVSMNRLGDTDYIPQVYIGDYQPHVWLSDTGC